MQKELRTIGVKFLMSLLKDADNECKSLTSFLPTLYNENFYIYPEVTYLSFHKLLIILFLKIYCWVVGGAVFNPNT